MDVRGLRSQVLRERAGRRRPRAYSSGLRRAVVAQVHRERMTGRQVTALASALGLSRYTILGWLKRSAQQARGTFLPIAVQAPSPTATLVVPGGYELRGDVSSLAAIVRALSS